MALHYLSIGYYSLVVLAVICFILIFYKSGNLLNKMYIIWPIALYSMLLSLMNYTAQPSNFVLNKIIALFLGICAATGFFFKISKKSNLKTIRLLIYVSIFGNLIVLFL